LEGRTRIDPRLSEAVSGVTGGTYEPVARPRESGPLPWRVRHRFPILERLVYINSCSQGALSDTVRTAYDDYLRDWDVKGALVKASKMTTNISGTFTIPGVGAMQLDGTTIVSLDRAP